MYIRYIYKLRDMHHSCENYTGMYDFNHNIYFLDEVLKLYEHINLIMSMD